MATLTMSSFTISSPLKKQRRVTFALDEPELLMKPKPIMVAVYIVNGNELITNIKTAEEIEAEELAQFKKMKKSKNAWKPKRCTDYEEQFLSEDEDLNDAVWELLTMALDADKL